MEGRIQYCRAQSIIAFVFFATDKSVISGNQCVLTHPDFVNALKIFAILQPHLRSQLINFFLAETMIRISLKLFEVKSNLFHGSDMTYQLSDRMDIPCLIA